MLILDAQLLGAIGVAWLFCATLQLLLWGIQRRRREADIVDVGWAGSLGCLACAYALLMDGEILGRICVAFFGVLWSLRLGGYLFWHRVLVPGEDERYLALREGWGTKAQRNFFFLFQAQALLSVILSIPFLVICVSSQSPSFWQTVVAFALFALSMLGESIADSQLRKFRADPRNRGRVCCHGLWRYSRHPNYFFEWVYWWSYVALGILSPWGFLTLLGPMIMYYFLRYLTGIPATEARTLQSRGTAYREYQQSTNAFFPWFPRYQEKESNA
jgi:steroid 5-alpha reductase family enzyme